jgi:retron-type reverse transcriptase
MKVYKDIFNKIINIEHLFLAWNEFKLGKGSRPDVIDFEMDLEPNLFELHRELASMTYKHCPYSGFFITDPKRRHVHKASVRDRVLHHAIFNILNPIFEPTFIASSFSCRENKGSHKGVEMVQRMLLKESENNTAPCYALKCDIRKFFDSIDHKVLLSILYKKIKDQKARWLLQEIVGSFENEKSEIKRERERERESMALRAKGIPIGNLTSQLFANVYMNEFDQFVKHVLKIQHYARYTDDFIIVARDKEYLNNLIKPIEDFLNKTLCLDLHPEKILIRKYSHGIDFLGYVILPYHKLVRKRTWKRMLRKFRAKIRENRSGRLAEESINQSLQSYLGILGHANTHKITEVLKNQKLF